MNIVLAAIDLGRSSARVLSRALRHFAVLTLAMSLLLPAAGSNARAQTSAESQAIVMFQRAADSYAFAHRQNDRRGRVPSSLAEGTFFTPQVAATLRAWIRIGGCELPAPVDGDFVVPRVNATTDGTRALSSCLGAVLPRLPPELEYRSAGVALVLADAHLHVVVDVLHAAFPGRDN